MQPNPENDTAEETPQSVDLNEQTLVGEAAQSAEQLMNPQTPQPVDATPLPTETPLPQVQYSDPQPSQEISLPSEPLQPETAPLIAPGAVFGGSMASISQPVATKSKKKWLIPLILALVFLLILIGGLAFYFAYWTRSDVVYQRFQKNIARVVDKTGESEIDLVNDYTYKVNVSSESDELSLSANSDGRAVESGFSTLSDVSYKGASLNIEGRLLNESNGSPYQLYFKLKGVKGMLDAVYAEDDSLIDSTKVTKYDDKWIFVDLTSFIDSSGEGEKVKALSKDQYKELWKTFAPIIKSRLVGLGEGSDVYTTSNPRSDKVAGKSTWAYDITYNKLANNEMIDEFIKAVDTTSLDSAQKDLVKKTLEEGKDYIPPEEESSGSRYVSKYRTDEKVTIWVEKNSGVIMQFMTTTESFYDDVSESKSTVTASITDITPELIRGSISYLDTSEYNSSDGKVNIVLDNNTKTLSADGEFLSKNLKDDKEETKFKFTLKIEPNTNESPIEPPTGAIDLEKVTQDLYGQTF